MDNTLVLTQYREGDKYNDFLGKFYHFPVNKNKNYLSFFSSLPIEFVYYEPIKKGKGEFFGYGRIVSPPFIDKNDNDYFFVEIVDYKPFSIPVSKRRWYDIENVYWYEFYHICFFLQTLYNPFDPIMKFNYAN